MDTKLEVLGTPVFTAEFHNVPSRNARKSWRGQMGVNAEWRFEAKEKALNYRGLQWHEGFFAQCEPLIEETALVVVTIFLRSNGICDVHNSDIKPILDGFTDGGVWPDDEWAFVPLVLFAWGGIDPGNQRLVIDVYDLSSYTKDGRIQSLPAGRTRIRGRPSKNK